MNALLSSPGLLNFATERLREEQRIRADITPESLRRIIDISPKLDFLFEPHRFKVAYSGRDATKSWSYARALLVQGIERPLRILGARETQQSIADSVHKLLEDQIVLLRLQRYYKVYKTHIVGTNGTEFFYAGLKHNISKIKSVEGCDIVWVEEGQSVSKNSWNVLIPTVRKEGSEIWVTFNPEMATDEAYVRFVFNPTSRGVVVKLSWRDNKWLTEEMRIEMDDLRERDPDQYEHVYEGATKSTVEGAVYKSEITAAEQEGRITKVPYDATKPVDTFWDLGYGDMVSIWFAQSVAFEYRFLDYYENSRQKVDFYLQILQSKGYTYGTCVLPWDGGAKQLGTGRSIEELIRAKGFKVKVLPQTSVTDGINAVRTIFPQCFFDSEKCVDGLSGLRRYQWGPPSPNKLEKQKPLHDVASHPADAMRTAAMYIQPPKPPKPKSTVPPRNWGSGDPSQRWMG